MMRGKKTAYICLGIVSVALAVLCAILPVLPSFPFVFSAAVCFAKGSDRLHSWFLGTRLYKYNFKSYSEQGGMTLKAKLRIIVCFTALMLCSLVMLWDTTGARIALLAVWIAQVGFFGFYIKTVS